MRVLILCTCILLSAGCAQTQELWRDAAGDASPPSTFAEEMVQAIELAEISYGNGIEDEPGKRVYAAGEFSRRGYNVLYFHPRSNLFARDPNLFVLGRRGSNSIILLFTGTEVSVNRYDIIQDLKTTAYVDQEVDGYFYVPSGHAGFRSGILNLIANNFVDSDERLARPRAETCADAPSVLAEFTCRFEIVDDDHTGPVEVTIVGHSLGAGLAQVAMPMIEGLEWRDRVVGRKPSWPYRVRYLFAFAPPLAVYSQFTGDCERIVDNNPIDVLAANDLTSRSHMIIREGDMVPVLWNPIKKNMHCVPGEHFGTYHRIPHDGEGMETVSLTSWRLDRPHASSSYARAIRQWAEPDTDAGSGGE